MSSRNGTVVLEEHGAAVRFERFLPHGIETVWAAITEPAQLAQWFGPAHIEAWEGGAVELTPEGPPAPEEARRVTGRVLTWEPPHVFEYESRQEVSGTTAVRYELRAVEGGVALILTHRRLDPEAAGGFAPGWGAYLDRLEAHVAGAPLPEWMERYEAAEAAHGGGNEHE